MNKYVAEKTGGSSAGIREVLHSVTIPIQQADDTFGLFDALALVKRRSRLISTIVLTCTLIAAIAAFTVPKIYTAHSAVVLERKDIRPFATDASLQSLDRDRSAAETEMDILRSRQFAGRVVDRLNLIDDANFNPYLNEVDQKRTSASRLLGYLSKLIGSTEYSTQRTALPSKEVQHNRAITILLTQYSVKRTGESLAVEITETNQNPELAASIANTIANLYVKSSLEFKQDERMADKNRALSTRGAVGFLRQSITQPLLVTLRSEEARLQQKKDELSVRFGKNHPQIIEAASQISSVQAMIDSEVQRIILDLEAESLKPSARVLSSAEIPTSPSFPKPGLIIPVTFLCSILLAVLLAILLEASDTRIRSGRRASHLLQIPNLGYVPKNPKKRASPDSGLPSFLAVRHDAYFIDAERAVYMACRYSNVSKPDSVAMVTSCTKSTASSSLAWGIAASAAADGRATVFIEFDFNKKNTSKMVATRKTQSLVGQYLRDETELVAIIEKIPNMPALGFIDASGILREPDRPLTSRKLYELLAAIKKNGYDLIVLHAPPVLTAADANWLSPFVDGVILSVSWGKTTEGQLLDAASQLRMNGATLVGTVIDEVNPIVHSKLGYGGSVLAAKPI